VTHNQESRRENADGLRQMDEARPGGTVRLAMGKGQGAAPASALTGNLPFPQATWLC